MHKPGNELGSEAMIREERREQALARLAAMALTIFATGLLGGFCLALLGAWIIL